MDTERGLTPVNRRRALTTLAIGIFAPNVLAACVGGSSKQAEKTKAPAAASVTFRPADKATGVVPTTPISVEVRDGWFQHVDMPMPAVLTIQSGINKLRYATLMGIKKAKTKEVKRVTVGELGVSAAPVAVVERVYLPQRTKQTQILDGSAKEAAAKLVEKLKFEVRVI